METGKTETKRKQRTPATLEEAHKYLSHRCEYNSAGQCAVCGFHRPG